MKKRQFAIVAVAAAAFLLWATAPGRAQQKGLLDGKTFAGDTGEKGKTENGKDELHFADGKFHSTACDQYGFGEAPYTATVGPNGAINWTARTTSAKEGKIEWKGTVKGDDLNGSFAWTKAGQKPIDYWIKASAKK